MADIHSPIKSLEGSLKISPFFNMAKLFLAVFVLSIAFVDCFFFPQHHREPKCHTIYETSYRPECSVKHIEKCVSFPSTKYDTKLETVCSTSVEKKCEQVFRDVPDKLCKDFNEQQCVTEQKTTYETGFRESCNTVPSQQCSQSHGSYGGYGKRKRSAEPSHNSNCQTVYNQVCKKVQIQVPKTTSVPRCSTVPKTQCINTIQKVAETKCIDVPRQNCQQVPKKVAIQTSAQKCESVPQKHCTQVPVSVPRRICGGRE